MQTERGRPWFSSAGRGLDLLLGGGNEAQARRLVRRRTSRPPPSLRWRGAGRPRACRPGSSGISRGGYGDRRAWQPTATPCRRSRRRCVQRCLRGARSGGSVPIACRRTRAELPIQRSLAVKASVQGATCLVTGSNPGSKLSATEPNSGQREPLYRAESHRLQPDPSGWGPGGRRFKSCLPDPNFLQITEVGSLVHRPGNATGNKFGKRAGTWSMAWCGGLRAPATTRFLSVIP